MKKGFLMFFLFLLFPNINGLSKELNEDIKKFFLAEEAFYAKEYLKAKGLYLSLKLEDLPKDYFDEVIFKLAVYTNIKASLSVLSNRDLDDKTKRLKSFLEVYLGVKEPETLNEVMSFSEDLSRIKDFLITNTNFSDPRFYLYLSVLNTSSYMRSLDITNTPENSKVLFLGSRIFQNLGMNDQSQKNMMKLIELYPDTFFGYMVLKNNSDYGEKYAEKTQSKKGFTKGYYIMLPEKDKEIITKILSKEYSLVEIGSKTLVGPFTTYSEADKEAKKIAKKYMIELSIIQLR